MRINEIFHSIQGEGLWMGLPNIFVRTTGCNLRCTYCDTTYAYEAGDDMTTHEILKHIQRYSCKYICITGGEPVLQKDLPEFLNLLYHHEYQVSLETNGSQFIKPFTKYKNLLISLDIKCPSSGMSQQMQLTNLTKLRRQDQIKFIVQTKKDFTYAKNIIETYQPNGTSFIQPVWGTDPQQIAQWILKEKIPFRLGIQLHKILWGNTDHT